MLRSSFEYSPKTASHPDRVAARSERTRIGLEWPSGISESDPAPECAGAGQVKRSDPDDVAGLWTLGAVDDFELDVLSLFE